GMSEAEVVLEKIDMPKDMCGDQEIGNLRVGVEEKGQTGVAVEDNLIDFRQPHGTVEMLVLIDLAIRPMARSRRETIGGHLGHNVLRHHFKGHRKKIEALLARQGFEFCHTCFKHAPSPAVAERSATPSRVPLYG